MRKVHPRSPYEKLGGFVHLPRLIDKATLHRKGLLNGYNYKTVGFDKHLLAFLKLDPDAFEEAANRLDDDGAILEWVQKNAAKHTPEAVEQWNQAMISQASGYGGKKSALPSFSEGSGRRRTQRYPDLLRSYRIRRRAVEVKRGKKLKELQRYKGCSPFLTM